MKPEKSWEYGLDADCWHCGLHFVKLLYCDKCGYYKCSHCGKCGCQLTSEVRLAIDKTFAALAPVLRKRNSPERDTVEEIRQGKQIAKIKRAKKCKGSM